MGDAWVRMARELESLGFERVGSAPGRLELRVPAWEERIFGRISLPGPLDCADRLTLERGSSGSLEIQMRYWSRCRAAEHLGVALLCLLPSGPGGYDRLSFALLAQALVIGAWWISLARVKSCLAQVVRKGS